MWNRTIGQSRVEAIARRCGERAAIARRAAPNRLYIAGSGAAAVALQRPGIGSGTTVNVIPCGCVSVKINIANGACGGQRVAVRRAESRGCEVLQKRAVGVGLIGFDDGGRYID